MKHVTHYVFIDLIELTRKKPHSWCSTSSVSKHLAKQAAFARYCAAHADEDEHQPTTAPAPASSAAEG